MSTLSLDSLSYQIKNKRILNQAYFQLQTGEIVELIGVNGTGKSTFLELLFGTKKPQHWHLRIDQKVIQKSRHLQRYFALKPQFSIFPKQLRVQSILPVEYWNWPEFEGKTQEKIHHFSTGIQQLIQTLFVLNLPQPFCLLGEPFAGLSPILQERLAALITEKAKTKGILLVNHLPDLLIGIRTRQMALKEGVFYQTTDDRM